MIAEIGNSIRQARWFQVLSALNTWMLAQFVERFRALPATSTSLPVSARMRIKSPVSKIWPWP